MSASTRGGGATSPLFDKPEADPSFPKLEEEILALWRDRDVFARSVRGEERFVFYDGPPFATGRPHYGHLLAGTLKDIVPRYWAMRGYHVERRFGWDTHGLPVEMEIEKDLELSGPRAIEAYGIDKYNEACRAIVQRYTGEWREVVTRMGRWVDFDNDYKTLDPSFMESVWWVFRQLWDKGLIYQGYKVMPYSWRLGTPLSNFEANMDYRKVQDPAVTVTFPIVEAPSGMSALVGAELLAWTTTPWTLPSNMALCVSPDEDYVLAWAGPKKAEAGLDNTYLVAEALAEKVLGEGYRVEQRFMGWSLVGVRYEPIFPFFADEGARGAFRVVSDDYVTTEEGTGIVHQAPAYGEDDWRICDRAGIPLVDPVDNEGRFTEAVPLVAGQLVKEADKALIGDLKARDRLFERATLDHDYPFCWRSGTPLIYKAISTWFVRVSDLRERMVAHNKQTTWVPEYVGDKRFGNWLADARDWAISRNRYWGTPLPVWINDATGEQVCIGSIEQLQALCGQPVEDLHRHHIDDLTWPGDGGGTFRRIPEVLDCWFESGSMPYAQNHYPFEHKELVEQNLPADFIAEGLDQTRGWFYTLLVLSTALFDRPAFQNVIVNGLILAEDGHKMSKRLKNYPDPAEVIERFGADALRAYLIDSPVVRAEPMRFSERGVREVVRSVILPLWNAYSFFATYAAVDGWAPPAGQGRSAVSDRALLDRWLLSMAQSLVRDVHAEMEGYRLYNVIPRVLGFIDHLTNWYIRLSRRRFWRSDDDLDKQHAFETLYEVLTLFARLLAPILPFMSEVLYQRLEAGKREGALDSVHLELLPMADKALVDAELEAAMAAARTVVTLGRNLREQHKLRVRQPLPKITVAALGSVAARLSGADLQALIASELNVVSVAVTADVGTLATLQARANFKALGRRLGKKMKPVAQAIAAADGATIARWRAGEQVEVEGELIGPGDVQIVQQASGEGALASDGDVTVLLDATVTEALRREGLAREVISKVQQLRKDSGFEVEDRITLELDADDDALRASLQAHAALISDEVLAAGGARIAVLDGQAGDVAVVDIVGTPLRCRVARVEPA